MEYELNADLTELLNIYNSKHGTQNDSFIRKAFDFANKKHSRMVRGTGEAFINHPLRVAKMVAEWGFDSDVIAAALLHDVVEQCGYPVSKIVSMFNEEVGNIIESAAVVSEKEFLDRRSRQPVRILSASFPKKKMYDKALYVKIADRLDNLSTIEGIDESAGIKMAKHTRSVFIPMVRAANAYHFVDQLEDLCFRTEHPEMYEEIYRQYHSLLNENRRRCKETLDEFLNVFTPLQNNEISELRQYHQYIVNFRYDERSCVSIYRQISRNTENIRNEWNTYVTKSNVPLYDLTLIVSDQLAGENSGISPDDLFFLFFDKSLSHWGYYLMGYGFTTYKDGKFFLISDDTGDLFRLFVRTDKDYQRFSYGDIVDQDSSLFRSSDSDAESYGDKIKVFRTDGTPLFIKRGATVLDYAFHIDIDTGLHFDYALINESNTRLEKYTVLNDGDIVTVIENKKIKPDLTWFEYVRTGKAVHALVEYFSKKPMFK